MLTLNPRLINPDEAFVTETGEIFEVLHALYLQDGLCYFGTLTDGKYTQFYEEELTFLTHKWDWHTYANAEKWSAILDQAKERAKYGD